MTTKDTRPSRIRAPLQDAVDALSEATGRTYELHYYRDIETSERPGLTDRRLFPGWYLVDVNQTPEQFGWGNPRGLFLGRNAGQSIRKIKGMIPPES